MDKVKGVVVREIVVLTICRLQGVRWSIRPLAIPLALTVTKIGANL